MRIIAGKSRGVALETLPGQETRPTLERVKEGMFSAVQFWLPGAKVLDLYAGSGQLGLEALSRGAASCLFVDFSPKAVAVIRRNAEKAGFLEQCRVYRKSVEDFLARPLERYDLLLLDPPYQSGIFPEILFRLAPFCGENAVVLCESEAGLEMPLECAGLHREKNYRYGTVQVSRYRFSGEEEKTPTHEE
ncbi:16S rRNA (guanine(966)-N(2))-methyltransferase RsmD [Ruminococcaceae bacterium OttesenSCG-928-I18]|nr:16S rRNA (guanine(966)-N(2))-methyltransferase RsmD [Ruminococcaceae bacterium OttesenSCG-928-I18]